MFAKRRVEVCFEKPGRSPLVALAPRSNIVGLSEAGLRAKRALGGEF